MHALPNASQWIRTILRFRSQHPSLQRVLDTVESLQDHPYRTNALLLGEPGTGKEGLARALHALMHADDAPFVEASLGGRDPREALIELCGEGDVRGLLEEAHGGTLYLDEVATLSREMQVRLLAAVRGSVRREGTRIETAVKVTVIASSDHDLDEAVRTGRMRHDLYWRLARIVLTLPPLRERRGDIARLAVWIGTRIVQKNGSNGSVALEGESDPGDVVLSQGAQEALHGYDWPGNFRELDAVLERALLLYGGQGARVEREHIERALQRDP